MRILFELVRIVTICSWALLGFVFWVPFLARMVAFFTGSILVFVSSGQDISASKIGLDKAVRFYPEGFSMINESISDLINGKVTPTEKINLKDDFWIPLVIHFVFAIIFWAITLTIILSVFKSA